MKRPMSRCTCPRPAGAGNPLLATGPIRTHEEVAAEMARRGDRRLTRSRIMQIEHGALDKIRAALMPLIDAESC